MLKNPLFFLILLAINLSIVNTVSASENPQQAAANTEAINKLPPVDFIKLITKDMLKTVTASKTEIDAKPEVILSIVDEKIMPFIATKTIARKVMGLPWKKASDTQKEAFTKEFTTYLKRFYSRAFLSYDNQLLVYNPKPRMRGSKIATVYTSLTEKGKPDVAIDYKLYKKKDGGWVMIDIVIEGISLVINNQRQYSGQIKSEGIDSVIVKLTYNNKQEFK